MDGVLYPEPVWFLYIFLRRLRMGLEKGKTSSCRLCQLWGKNRSVPSRTLAPSSKIIGFSLCNVCSWHAQDTQSCRNGTRICIVESYYVGMIPIMVRKIWTICSILLCPEFFLFLFRCCGMLLRLVPFWFSVSSSEGSFTHHIYCVPEVNLEQEPRDFILLKIVS